MNDQLSDFTRLLYGEHYRQGRSRPLLSVRSIDNLNSYLLGNLLEPYISLYTILVDSSSSSSSCSFSSRSEDLNLESHLVYSIVNELVLRISPSSIFIITPHRMQRSAIKKQFSKNPFSNVLITCDTVERMQGKEAQCIILCMLYRQREILENELDFIYNRQRINVSITRAQQLCILLTSQLLFNQPPLEVFVNENTRNAYNLLNNYVNKSTRRYLDNHGNIK
jgi:superfamily I DNA and/or RNA helicase